MKLKDYTETLEEKMTEFDVWVTPSLGEIIETPQYNSNMKTNKYGFDVVSSIAIGCRDENDLSAKKLAQGLILLIKDKPQDEQDKILSGFFNVMLLVTGKTDNNLKCQYPLQLINKHKYTTIPKKTAKKGWVNKPLPRTIELESEIKIIQDLSEKPKDQLFFVETYIETILSDKKYYKQLWVMLKTYGDCKCSGSEESILSPFVVFQSRGSATAVQGHIPENILRSYMNEWGMISGEDYNEEDIELERLLAGVQIDKNKKMRKFDFVLPFKSKKDGGKIFIQSQFYAGDSGSVSHKVVDQTDSSRAASLKKYTEAKFIEYLDGAGYFAKLNCDLRKMLAKDTTTDFIQIKSAPVKLRRELQKIDFLTPLEVEHAVVLTDGEQTSVINSLKKDGYSDIEIDRVLELLLEKSMIGLNGSKFVINSDRVMIVRRYLLLDVIANYGSKLPSASGNDYYIVPGYGSDWGMPKSDIIKQALKIAPALQNLWVNKTDCQDDINWLEEKGFILSR